MRTLKTNRSGCLSRIHYESKLLPRTNVPNIRRYLAAGRHNLNADIGPGLETCMRVRLSSICRLLAFIGVVSCWGHAQQDQAQQGQAQQKPEIKIGFSIEATNGERWQTDLDEFQARAQQL